MVDDGRNISPERKAAFYIGMGMAGLGFMLFLSVFVSSALHFGDFSQFEERGRSMAIRAIGGMVLMIVGGIVSSVGRAGLAGSGLKIDPQGMRKDLEPWNRSAGGMLSDTLEEANLGKNLNLGASPKEIVKIRCPKCGALNDEHSKFCGQCGSPI
jgi:hypothetical protein